MPLPLREGVLPCLTSPRSPSEPGCSTSASRSRERPRCRWRPAPAATTLLRHGVLYPGTEMNQRDAVLGFMGRRWGWTDEGIPPRQHWDELMAEIEADDRAPGAVRARVRVRGRRGDGEAIRRRHRRELSHRGHAAQPRRDPAVGVAAVRQGRRRDPVRRLARGGHRRPARTARSPRASTTATTRARVVAALGRRGRRRPRHRRSCSTSSGPSCCSAPSSSCSACPTGTLAAQELGGFASNRGLTVPEVELFRRAQRAHPAPRRRVGRLRAHRPQRRAAPGHGTAARPTASGRSSRHGRSSAPPSSAPATPKQIAATGVQVIGDLDHARRGGAGASGTTTRRRAEIPVELAAEAMAGHAVGRDLAGRGLRREGRARRRARGGPAQGPRRSAALASTRAGVVMFAVAVHRRPVPARRVSAQEAGHPPLTRLSRGSSRGRAAGR